MVSINKIRTAIRIKFALPDASGRTQSKIVGIPHNTMIRLSARLDRAAITHEIAEELTDSELMVKLYPSIVHNNRSKRAPNIEHIMTELTKPRGKGTTKAVLYLEYVAEDPKTAMSRSHFYRNINKVLKRSKLVMKQLHAAGEAVFIDYAGYQVFYRKSNKKVWVKVFVAVLGASKKVFAWATYGEKTVHWIDGMTRMFEDFGGVPEVVAMDNAKALVTKPGLIPIFTKNVESLEEHYGCFMDTSRPRSPQDKSHAELGVKFVTQRILVPMMRNHTFFSLEEINDYLTKEIAVLNNTPFQGLPISRNDLFEKNEKTVLNPLPTTPYQMVVDWLRQKVLPNYCNPPIESE
ncbi:IS21 family transposase [Glaciecola siphonariae]|uniref:IS21 family transposase n=1 Tax=Glaciecola siphonariae TaxID=521012 RepID=A0ABV9M020_9ALTE